MEIDPWRVLTTYSRDVAYIADLDGCLTWLSEALPRVLGWQVEDLLGRPLRDLVHPDDREAAMAWRALLTTRTDTEGLTTDPLRFRRPDGTYLWCGVSAARAFDESGAPIGVTGSVHDVDDVVRARIAAADAHSRLHALLEAQVEPLVSLVALRNGSGDVIDFVFEDVNQPAADFHGTTIDQLVGSTVLQVLGREAGGDDVDTARSVLETGEAVIVNDAWSFVRARQGADPTWLDVRVVPVDEERVSYSWRDVTDRYCARVALGEAHGLLRRVIDAQVDPHVLLSAVRDESGRIVDFTYLDANESAAEYEGVPREQMVGASILDVYHDATEARQDIDDCITALESGRPVVRNDAATVGYADASGRPIVTDNRIVPVDADLVSYTWRDVTDRHHAQQALAESEERLRLLAENMTDIVALIREQVIIWVSPSVTRTLGWQPEELIGQSPAVFTHPEDMPKLLERWLAVPDGDLPRQRYRLVTRDGASRWVDTEGRIINPSPRTVVVTARVVDAEVAALRALEDMARHDELTGLVNRHAVFDHVSRSLEGDVRSGTKMAMVFCDLDDFKTVNDTYGHSAGDALLRSIARRLERAVRSGDMVARIGGDELLVVLNGVRDLDDAVSIAEKLRAEVRQPTPVPGGMVTVSASVGVAIAEPGEGVDDIVARSDAAMYDAKRTGKDRVVAIRADKASG